MQGYVLAFVRCLRPGSGKKSGNTGLPEGGPVHHCDPQEHIALHGCSSGIEAYIAENVALSLTM